MPSASAGRSPARLRARAARLTGRAKAQAFRQVLSLPTAQVRRLTGRPVVIDGNTLAPHTQLMLRLMRLSGERGAETMPLAKGRLSMDRQASMASGEQPIGQVHDRAVRGAAGPIPARLYVPRGVTGAGPWVVFFHGGGMVYGSIESHDGLCRFIAEETGFRVLSVAYRLAPEHPFPAGVDDAFAAYEWVASNAADYDADPTRLAVAGDSAGGYLAAATALRAARERVPLAYQLLIYPMTEQQNHNRSRTTFGEGFYLTKEFMNRAEPAYLDGADRHDPRASVIFDEVPPGLAPAYVATAGFDPLRDEGDAYAEKLRAAGTDVTHTCFPGEIHGFANLLIAECSAKDAVRELCAALRTALA